MIHNELYNIGICILKNVNIQNLLYELLDKIINNNLLSIPFFLLNNINVIKNIILECLDINKTNCLNKNHSINFK